MRHLFVAAAAFAGVVTFAAPPAHASEATFDRTLTVNGKADLAVATSSGSIHISPGPGNRIHIFARVKTNWGGSDDQVRSIADHPPIEQTGNIVRIGPHHENYRNINIDYEIEAPADTFLNVSTGSGGVIDEGVGVDAKLSTGSGSIHATGLHGSFSADTGSGTIYAEQSGEGDVKAETGSGSIELRSVHGGLHAHTGSGSIKVAGTPSAPWKLETGSGSIEIWSGSAAFTIDAETGSGSVHSDREMLTSGEVNRHHITGKVGGGGPLVHADTGSGSIRIH